MRFWKRSANQSGDTIVEVLIVIAVLSSVLMGAFAVSQKSSAAVRDSQEHSEMLQVLQGQLELVRSLALKETNDTTGVFNTPTKYFCVNPETQAIINQPNLADEPSLATFSKYNAGCANQLTRYNIAVTYNGSPARTFTFSGRWDSLTGNQGAEKLVYRVYPRPPAPTTTDPVSPLGLAEFDSEDYGTPTAPKTRFDWGKIRWNRSVNDAAVESCKWEYYIKYPGTSNFVLAQPDPAYPAEKNPMTTACNNGERQIFHYKPLPGYEVFDLNKCAGIEAKIVLTLRLSNGTNPSKPEDTKLPNCLS